MALDSFLAALETVRFMEIECQDMNEPMTLDKSVFKTPYQMVLVLKNGSRLTFVGKQEGVNLARLMWQRVRRFIE